MVPLSSAKNINEYQHTDKKERGGRGDGLASHPGGVGKRRIETGDKSQIQSLSCRAPKKTTFLFHLYIPCVVLNPLRSQHCL